MEVRGIWWQRSSRSQPSPGVAGQGEACCLPAGHPSRLPFSVLGAAAGFPVTQCSRRSADGSLRVSTRTEKAWLTCFARVEHLSSARCLVDKAYATWHTAISKPSKDGNQSTERLRTCSRPGRQHVAETGNGNPGLGSRACALHPMIVASQGKAPFLMHDHQIKDHIFSNLKEINFKRHIPPAYIHLSSFL